MHDVSSPTLPTESPSLTRPGIFWHWNQPLLVLHPVTIGLLAGLLASFALALTPPQSRAVAAPISRPVVAASTAAAVVPPAKINAPVVAAPTDRLQIPDLGVNAPVKELGLVAGVLDTPKTLWQVGHYSGSSKPGAPGTAIMVGHSGAPGQRGIFEHLDRLKSGTLVTYRYIDGRSYTYRVLSSAAYADDPSTAQLFFSNTAAATLNLITCYGTWNTSTKSYSKRWIVTATLQP